MKYLAAYALLTLSGKKNISGNDVKQLLGSAQVNISDEDLNRLVASLKGKDINKLIAEGSSKIGGAPAPVAATGKPAVVQKKKQQPKKQAKKKEVPKEDSDEDMGLGGGLFD